MPVPPKYFADFSSSRTDPQNFPFATWAKLMREIISEKSAELMANAPCGGVFELRCAIAEHLREFRGIDADPNCIVVGAGTEYLYGLLIQLLGFDKVYALEDPGYRKIAQVYESYGVQYRFTPMDKEGIDPKALEKAARIFCTFRRRTTSRRASSRPSHGVTRFSIGPRRAKTVTSSRTITIPSSASPASLSRRCKASIPPTASFT